jgi:hypothetical protein
LKQLNNKIINSLLSGAKFGLSSATACRGHAAKDHAMVRHKGKELPP